MLAFAKIPQTRLTLFRARAETTKRVCYRFTWNVQCSVNVHTSGRTIVTPNEQRKKKRRKRKKRKTTGTTGRKRRNVKPTRFGAETTSATQPGEIGVHELREYEFKASRLGMTARNSEIQEQRARYRPRHRLALPRGAAPHRSLYARGSYFRSLVRTHLIYGSVYASHRRGGRYRGGENVYIDYRRCERGTIECNQRRVRRGAALSALILNRGSCGCLECLSGIFLRLFVI